MSLYDDICDIEHALKSNPIEKKLFLDFVERFNEVEKECGLYRKNYNAIRSAIQIVKETDALGYPVDLVT